MGGSASAPMRLLCLLPSAERCGVPAFSGDHDDLDADRVIGTLCPRVPGRKRHLMLLGGECYECVIDGATCDAQTAERMPTSARIPRSVPLLTSWLGCTGTVVPRPSGWRM